MNEGDAVALFEALAGRIGSRGVTIGIGDDAAVLEAPPGEALVACVDTLNLDTHFTANQSPESVGHRALAVNLSDLAAMGATPHWVLLSLSMPAGDPAWLAAFADGFGRLAADSEVALVGGDTTRGPLAVTVTALGSVPHAGVLRRGTAAPGDRIWVSGTPGDAALALAEPGSGSDDRLLWPTPRLALGVALRGVASACIDLSDGLALDLPRLLDGLGGRIAVDVLPLSEQLAGRTEGWRFALAGGDDYELCFCAPPARDTAVRAAAAASATPVAAIGQVLAEPRCEAVLPGGAIEPLRSFRGYEHFA